MNWELATVGLALLLVAAVSRQLTNTPVTPAMAMVAIGILVGPLLLDDLNIGPTSSTVRKLAEAALAVVLFGSVQRWRARRARAPAAGTRRLAEPLSGDVVTDFGMPTEFSDDFLARSLPHIVIRYIAGRGAVAWRAGPPARRPSRSDSVKPGPRARREVPAEIRSKR
jgi:hypothetical protein